MIELTLIGIADHFSERANSQVYEEIEKYGCPGCTLALEATRRDEDSGYYWGRLWRYAETMRMRVIPIDSRLALDITHRFSEQKRNERPIPIDYAVYFQSLMKGSFQEDLRRQRDVEEGKYLYVMTTLRDRHMIRAIKKHKPDLVVCGIGHTLAIQREFPYAKLVQVGEISEEDKRIDLETFRKIELMLQERSC